MDAIRIITGGENVCRDILDDLPEWFGSPEAKEAYIDNASRLPMLALMRDQQPDDARASEFDYLTTRL